MAANTKVILNPEGKLERELPISEVIIPDLWFHYQDLLKKASQVNGEYPEFAQQLREVAEEVCECWHIAHNLKRHIIGDDWPEGSANIPKEFLKEK